MHVALIYMASGLSRRFGSNKLLADVGGKPLFVHGLMHLCDAVQLVQPDLSCAITVVTAYEDIRKYCVREHIHCVWNHENREGIAASIRCGVRAVPKADAWAFFAADQPFLQSRTIAGFLTEFCHSKALIGCVCAGKRRGSPAVFAQIYKERLVSLAGDMGGKRILQQEGQVWQYNVSPEDITDIDTTEELKRVSPCLYD